MESIKVKAVEIVLGIIKVTSRQANSAWLVRNRGNCDLK